MSAPDHTVLYEGAPAGKWECADSTGGAVTWPVSEGSRGKKEAGDTATASDWFVLGNGYSQLKMFTAAIDAYQYCLKLNGRACPAWTNLGAALEEMGNTQGDLDDYTQAAALGDPSGKDNLATLTAAIQKAQEQNQQPQGCDAFCVGNRMHDGQMRDHFANHPGASISEANAHTSP